MFHDVDHLILANTIEKFWENGISRFKQEQKQQISDYYQTNFNWCQKNLTTNINNFGCNSSIQKMLQIWRLIPDCLAVLTNLSAYQQKVAIVMVHQCDFTGILLNWENLQKYNNGKEYDLLKMGDEVRKLTLVDTPPKKNPKNNDNTWSSKFKNYPITPRVLHTLTYHLPLDLGTYGSLKNFGCLGNERKNKDVKKVSLLPNFKWDSFEKVMLYNKYTMTCIQLCRNVPFKTGLKAGLKFINTIVNDKSLTNYAVTTNEPKKVLPSLKLKDLVTSTEEVDEFKRLYQQTSSTKQMKETTRITCQEVCEACLPIDEEYIVKPNSFIEYSETNNVYRYAEIHKLYQICLFDENDQFLDKFNAFTMVKMQQISHESEDVDNSDWIDCFLHKHNLRWFFKKQLTTYLLTPLFCIRKLVQMKQFKSEEREDMDYYYLTQYYQKQNHVVCANYGLYTVQQKKYQKKETKVF